MKHVVVTGATKGLGLAITSRLLREGYKVTGIGRMPSKDFLDLQSSYESSRLRLIQFDLSNIGELRHLAKTITEDGQRVYALINNAAVGLDGVLGTMHESDIEFGIRLNLQSPIILTKYLLRSMLLGGNGGRIINISSIIANTGFNGLSVYAATKSGLNGFTKSLARELGRAGITVNSIAPGFMETEMTKGLQGEKLASIKRRTPLKNLAQPDHVASMTSFLLSEDACSVTGTVVTVDAGATA